MADPMIEARSLWQLVERRASATPSELFAADDRGRTLDFKGYVRAAERTAAWLHEIGIRSESRVSWMLPTRLEAMVLMGALARLDAIQNPMLPAYRDKETRFVLHQTRAELFIVPSSWRGFDYRAMAEGIAAELGGIRVFAAELELPSRDPATLPPAPPSTGEATRWIYYTSGTTSDPKGAKHSDRTLLSAAAGLARALELRIDDRAAVVFPFTHVGGALWLMANLMSGGAGIAVEMFDPHKAIDLLSELGVTHAGAGTVFHQAYLEAQRTRGPAPIFPRLRGCPGGGAPKPPKLHFDLKAELGGSGIVSGYGLTECPAITMNALHDADEKLALTEGRKTLPATEIRVVTLDGRRARPAEEGEIRVAAPQLFSGYVDPALDADAFDADGFFRTGDLGKLDEDGYLTITGRIKDVIIRKGENISAKEIEDLLYTHSKVKEVAVIGVPDERLGERCAAIIVPRREGDPLGFEEMKAFLKDKGLMTQKIPEQLEHISELPRNAVGKIQKNALRDRFSPRTGR
jgi:acyl-CoA synthetase (AMP-forming)/AMP-acid ligase II